MINFFCEILPKRWSHCLTTALLLFKALRKKQTFYCNALAGESDFNICINCDLTVSCNCQDFDGRGHIGDLKEQSLEQIFDGTRARKFRAMLAARKFPLPTCVHCSDLRLIPRKDIGHYLTSHHVPHKGIMVENTALCNLRCHMCNREQLIKQRKGKLALSLKDVENIARILKAHGIKNLFYFNLGEPFVPADIFAQIKVIRTQTPDIRIITSTNGLLLDTDDKLEAALLMDYVYISLDGVSEETVSKYQVGGNFERTYQNMVNLCNMKKQRGRDLPIIEWKYVLFRWNDEPVQIQRATELAKSANVDLITFYNGEGPPLNKSIRWHYHPYFRKLGKKINGSIIVNLNKIPNDLLSP
jgi:pyruvate-formate lyase-activating enzyme